jgi:hypothetical protein
MKFIKLASLEDKLSRSGNPSDPLLVQVCRLEDTKNLLDWNKISMQQGGEEALVREIDVFIKGGKAREILSKQISKAKKRFSNALTFDRNNDPHSLELTYQNRKALNDKLTNAGLWDEALLGDNDYSSAFIYTLIASNIATNTTVKPSPESLTTLSEKMEEGFWEECITDLKTPEKMEELQKYGVKKTDLKDFNSIIAALSRISKAHRKHLGDMKKDFQVLVGIDPKKKKRQIPKDFEELSDEDQVRYKDMKTNMEFVKSSKATIDTMLQGIEDKRSMGENEIADLYNLSHNQQGIDTGSSLPRDIGSGWVFIPGKKKAKGTNNSICSDEDVRSRWPNVKWEDSRVRGLFVSELTKGTGWCITNTNTATSYIEAGDHMIYAEGGSPRICIRYSGSRIVEFTGFNNRPINIVPYANEVVDFCDKYKEIKDDLERFTGGDTHHSSLKQLKEDVVKMEEVNSWDTEKITNEVLNDIRHPKAGYGRRSTIDYLGDSKSNECLELDNKGEFKNPEFFNALRTIWMNSPNVEKEAIAGRFPTLKKDHQVQKKMLSLVGDHLRELINRQNDIGMGAINVSRMNNQFGQIPMKDVNIQDLVIEAYTVMSQFEESDDRRQSLFEDVERMIHDSGAEELIKRQVMVKCLGAIGNGDFETLRFLTDKFDLGEGDDIQNFKEEAIYDLEQFAEPYVYNPQKFADLDKFFDGRLNTEFLEDIREFAFPLAKKDLLGALKVTNIGVFLAPLCQEHLVKFPNLLEDEDIIESAIKLGGETIVTDKFKFEKLDDLFNKELSTGKYYEQVFAIGLEQALAQAKTYLEKMHFRDLIELNRDFKGKIVLDENIREAAKKALVSLFASGEREKAVKLANLFKYSPEEGDKMFDATFDALFDQAKVAMSQCDLGTLKELDRRTGRIYKAETRELKKGKVLGERMGEIIDGSRGMAKTYLLTKILIWPIKTIGNEIVPVHPIKIFTDLITLYGQELAQDPHIKKRCSDLLIKCSSFMDNNFYASVANGIKDIYGDNLVTKEDLEAHRKTFMRDWSYKAEEALEGEDLDTFSKIMRMYPELTRDNSVINNVAQFVFRSSRYLDVGTLQRAYEKKENAEKLDGLFMGAILSSKLGLGGYTRIKNTIQLKENEQNPNQNPA